MIRQYVGDGDVKEIFEELYSTNSVFSLHIGPMIDGRHENREKYVAWLDANGGNLVPNGNILAIMKNKMVFTTYKPITLRNSELFYIHFFHTRVTYRMNRQALDFMQAHRVYDQFFPNGQFEFENPVGPPPEQKWFRDGLNNEQKWAITNIINKVSYPLPFILFGPPGETTI